MIKLTILCMLINIFLACSSGCQTCNGGSCYICNAGYQLQTVDDEGSGYQFSTEDGSTSISQCTLKSVYVLIIVLGVPIVCGVIVAIILYCCKRIHGLRQYIAAYSVGVGPLQEIQAGETVQRIIQREPVQWKPYEKAFRKEDICSICLEANIQVQTNCQHLFHFRCAKAWHSKNKGCPACRVIVSQLKIICTQCKRQCLAVTMDYVGQQLCQNCARFRNL